MSDRTPLLLMVGTVAFVGVVATLAWLPDLPARLSASGTERAVMEEGCDLAVGACSATFPDGEVEVALSPAAPQGGAPIEVSVRSRGPTVPVSLRLTGVDMNMGQVVAPLAPAGEGHSAEINLPACTLAAMRWRLDVQLGEGESRRTATFGFWSGDRSAVTEGSGLHSDLAADRPLPEPGPPPSYGDFEVRTADGPLRLSDWRGDPVIVYFGYASCPDVCPTSLARIGQAMAALTPEEQRRVHGLFISVDPDRDRTDRLRDYAQYFHPNLVGATAEPAVIDAITQDWGVFWRKVELPDSALGYAVDHGTSAYLIAPDGSLAEVLPHGMPRDWMVEAIRRQLDPPAGPPNTAGSDGDEG